MMNRPFLLGVLLGLLILTVLLGPAVWLLYTTAPHFGGPW